MTTETKASIRKDSAPIISERYRNPKTIPLVFHFEPQSYASVESRLRSCTLEHREIDSKDIYIFDHFLCNEEETELRTYSEKSGFSRTIYADAYSKEKGEEPAKAMDNKEKWAFFSSPPAAVEELFRLLCFIAKKTNADVATLPWEMYDQDICATAVATNRIETLSAASMDLGKHKDFDTEEGISFGVPILYSANKELHPSQFVNGDKGKPLLVSLMLYATSKDFDPEEGLGTVFCDKNKRNVYHTHCRHGRVILFEGDIIHGISESKFPSEGASWRVSYVFKLVINPRDAKVEPRKRLREVFKR